MKKIQFFVFLLFIVANCSGYSLLENTADKANFPTVPPVKVGEKTFKIETFFNATWYRAGQFCRLHKMHLASINSQEESDKLEAAIASFNLTSNKFWTSGNDLDQSMSFVWQSTGTSLTFTAWRPDQPDNLSDGVNTEHCLVLTPTGWDDDFCFREFYFVCESAEKL